MGTNPKRTVTVQMVPQLAGLDVLGNKESNANWTKEPDLNLNQGCPGPNSTEHMWDNVCVTTTNTTSRIQTTGPREPGGGGVVTSAPFSTDSVRGKPSPDHVIGAEQLTGPTALPCRGGSAAEVAAEGSRDGNANLTALTPAAAVEEKEQDVCKAGLSLAVTSPEADVQTNYCRAKEPGGAGEGVAGTRLQPTAVRSVTAGVSSAARDDSLAVGDNKDTAAQNQKRPQTCDPKCGSVSLTALKQDTAKGSSSVTADTSALLPGRSKEAGDNATQGPSLSSSPPTVVPATNPARSECPLEASKRGTPGTISLKPSCKMEYVKTSETSQPEPRDKNVVAPVNVTTAIMSPSDSKADIGLRNKAPSSVPPENSDSTSSPIANKQSSLDKRQGESSSSQKERCSSPKAAQQTQNQQTQNQQTQNQQTQNQQTQNQPIQNQQTQDQPIQNEQTKNQPIQNKQTENQPIQNQQQSSNHHTARVANGVVQTAFASEQPKDHCKLYCEASTMTRTPVATPTHCKQCQDAEIQAVADVCSRAVSTSPSLFPLPPPYRSTDRGAALRDASGMVPSHHTHTGGDPPCLPPPNYPADLRHGSDRFTLEAGSCSSQSAGVVLHAEEAMAALHAEVARLGAKPKDPGFGGSTVMCDPQPRGALQPLQPVYQINIEQCGGQNEPPANLNCQQPRAEETPHSRPKPEAAGKLVVSKDIEGVPTRAALPPLAKAPASQIEYPVPSATAASSSKTSGCTAAPPSQSASSFTKPNQAATPTSKKAEDAKPVKCAEQPRSKPSGQKDQTGKQSLKSAKGGLVKGVGGVKALLGKKKQEQLEPERKEKEKGEEEGMQKAEKSIHDVVWDEQGMTWEVYGASVDPESLGFAIQSHLQCKIKEQEKKIVTRSSLRKSVTPDSPAAAANSRKTERRHHSILRAMLRNARRPKCCARPAPSAVLE
ncbi:G protein-regulated inducer of neurite outgrowth 3 [Esox lucius]|uniref:G protein-regulated inducer of neurite outgrowth C-terminal domain-containing protein n=1 Tax=Esox lucius TaxID=8010 RepID=A0A3P9A4M7_ESOLU|nr:G protein-regulated inducer of neurite outgrowth 3 [Esox lucius]